ncbi:MAG: hypothetical protein JSR19_06400 [Proteobacteria bacterium]|nr:hypothetical protein [Pseudomonadota bacterium]HQR05033.1 hypothetical protein [Rhodocyclaceae bacterium]
MLAGMVCLAAATAPALAAEKCESKDNRAIGAWKLNLQESIAPQGSPFRPYTLVVRRSDEVLDFVYKGIGHDGKPFDFAYNAQADGVVRELGSGLKGSMTRLPSGNYEARLWMPDGSFENKFCQLDASGNKDICLATLTAANGSVVFFKQVLDRQ